MKNKLLSFYIKYDPDFNSLIKIATSQLILKILLEKSSLNIKALRKEIEDLTKFKLKEKELKGILDGLIKKERVKPDGDNYKLTEETSNRLVGERETYESIQSDVIDEFFSGTSTSKNVVTEWFQNVMVAIFKTFQLEWMNAISKKQIFNQVTRADFEQILDKELHKNDQIKEEDYEWLKIRFEKFFSSNSSDANHLIWAYGTSIFSSTLISSRQFGDAITLDVLRNSMFILDTNVCMSLNLEGSEQSKALMSIENIIESLNITLHYLYISRAEYGKAIEHKKNEVLRIFENYEIQVLEQTEDAYIQTALTRGCLTSEDINRFFDTLMDIPNVFYEKVPLTVLDEAYFDDIYSKADDDESLHHDIDKIHKERFGRPKRENTRIHDARMIKLIKELRKSGKYWIISRDGTLTRYSMKKNLRDEFPLVIGLDVLINLFAVNPLIDPESFAPLFANIIKNSLIPERNAFCIEDLAYILDTQLDINKLPADKVVEIAKYVNHKKLEGVPDEEIRLYIRRELNSSKISVSMEAEEARNQALLERTERERIQKRNEQLEEEGRKKDIIILRKTLNGNLLKYLLLTPILFLLMILCFYFYFQIFTNNPDSIQNILILIVVEIILSISGGYGFLGKRIYSILKEKRKLKS